MENDFFLVAPRQLWKSPFGDYYIDMKENLVSACGYPSTAYYHGFIGTVPLLSQPQMHLL